MAENGTVVLSFKRFDVVSDDSDHFYAKRKKGLNEAATAGAGEDDSSIDSAAGSQLQKKIMREWRILEKNLPDMIYVRAYENRIDLLRAVIIGAAGTPYHDGLFFFDLAFPSDYPARPPMVQYRSYGLRLNPNLYSNGTVCLSLLNTWAGKQNERWNPAESTMLQVLVSIQALVLNERPYFNEPGTGLFGHARWEKNSRSYSRDVYLLSLKTTLFSIRNPPKNFEDFVTAHYRQRAKAILAACRAYANGRVRVGYYRDGENDDVWSAAEEEIDVSKKFFAAVKAMYSLLVMGFEQIGVTGVGGDQLKLESKTTSFRREKGTKKNGFVMKLFTTMKRVFGLKKKKVGKISNNNIVSVSA